MAKRDGYSIVLRRFFNVFLTGVGSKTRSIFFNDLRRYVSAGVSYYDAVTTMHKYCRNHHLRNILNKMRGMIDSGRGMGDALSLYPATFGEFELAMVDLGERTGKLDLALGNVSEKLKVDYEIKQKVIKGAFYPVLVLIVILAVAVLLQNQGYDMPFRVTPLSVGCIISAFIGLILLIKLIRVTPGLGYAFDSITCAIPFFGRVRMKAALARFATAFSYAYSSGSDIQQTLALAGRSAMNKLYEADATRIGNEIRAGKSLSEAFDSSRIMPPLLKQTIAVGEKTGDFDQALMNITEFAKEEVDTAIVMIVHASGVLAILLLGAFVLMIALSFYKQHFGRGLKILEQANPHFNK
ncbi:type II secretion system F family protein [bacterium]|nr:type II secretion system F family protein [bacterium]